MTIGEPFVREGGAGPQIVCLHSNASSSTQWRSLMERLAPRFHVLAPDAYGAGKSPEWPSARTIGLVDEVALIAPMLLRSPEPVTLVGHSYGAAVALKAAVLHPGRVRALALYEPTMFSLLDAQSPPPNDADGIREAVRRAATALDANDADAAAGFFIDYWMGRGSWEATPDSRKPPIIASIVNVRRWAHALTTEATPLAAFAALDIPVLYMIGSDSPASARGVARLLAPALPGARIERFEGIGHMGPITHADRINTAIEQFLLSL